MLSFTLHLVLQTFSLAAPTAGLWDALSPPPAVTADSAPPRARALEIAAAGGEAEVVHAMIWNDDTGRTLDACETVWDGALVLSDRFYLDAGSDTRSGGNNAGKAGLLPFTPTPLLPGETRHLVADIQIPAGTPPGRYSGHLDLHFSDGALVRQPAILEVFDFSLPACPTLPVLLGLDRPSFRERYGLGEALNDWAAIYDTLTEMRAGFEIWPRQNATGAIFYDDSDAGLILEHLDYAVRAPMLPAVGIGGPAGDLLNQWPPPAFNSPQDPLQFLLFRLMADLETHNWSRPTILIPEPLPPREDWQRIRFACARVGRADSRVTRLLAAPLHPFFERYADIWALPATTPPFALGLLNDGLSIARFTQPAQVARRGTPGADDRSKSYRTDPGDALDGCDATAWYPAGGSEGADSPWLEVEFEKLETLESLAILWPPGVAPILPEVETAYSSDSFSLATVRWEQEYGWSESGLPISFGTFRYPRECSALRVHFRHGHTNAFGVAEVLINQDGRTALNLPGKPAQPWLDLRNQVSPLNAVDTSGISMRLVPWYCWQQGFRGILGPVLHADNGGGLSVTGGEAGSAPSAELMNLREGLEDYEYLRLYWKAVREETVRPPKDFKPGLVPAPGRAGAQTELGPVLREERLRMGRLLSGQSIVTKNFGPRR